MEFDGFISYDGDETVVTIKLCACVRECEQCIVGCWRLLIIKNSSPDFQTANYNLN